MLTVYLLRDNIKETPGYSVFATDPNDKIVEKTIYNTLSYLEAVTQANVVFDVLKGYGTIEVACYLESDYETTYHLTYTVDEFTLRKVSNKNFYTNLLEIYETLLGKWSPQQAFLQVTKVQSLNSQQQDALKRLIDVQTVLSESFNE